MGLSVQGYDKGETMGHIGYTFRKESWPKGSEILIEKTNFQEAVIECSTLLNMNFIKLPEADIEEKYIIEKAYNRR